MGLTRAKAWIPVQAVLKISELPPNVTPDQIGKILSHVQTYPFKSGRLQKVKSGITMIQIYPAPALREMDGSRGSKRPRHAKSTEIAAGPATVSRVVHPTEIPTGPEDSTNPETDQLWSSRSSIRSITSIESVTDIAPPVNSESEQSSIAYVHFKSVSYCRDYLEVDNGEWEESEV